MSDAQGDERNEAKTQADIRESILDLREDLHNMQSGGESEEPSKKGLRYYLDRFDIPIFIAGVGGLFGFFYFDVSIPEWVSIVLVTGIAGAVFTFPIALYGAKRIVRDKRTPILEMNPKEFADVKLHFVPDKVVGDIEVIDGEMHTIQTMQGVGYQVERFEIVEGDKEQYVAKGTWFGGKSALEIRREESAIEQMEKNLRPMVERAIEYEQKWPFVGSQITSAVMNGFAQEFEGVSTAFNDSTYRKVQDIMDREEPAELDKDDFEEKVSQMNEDTNGHGQDFNGNLEEILKGDSE